MLTKKPTPLWEYVSGGSPQVDRDAGVIRGVKILGTQSANGRSYTLEAIGKAKGLYEGKAVNINHPGKPNDARSLADRFGRMKNVHEQADGLYGDLEFLTSHPQAATICEAAERMPGLLGLSHNAEGRVVHKDGKNLVEEILKVRSVDLVSDPATVQGLFEQAMPGEEEEPPTEPIAPPAEDPVSEQPAEAVAEEPEIAAVPEPDEPINQETDKAERGGLSVEAAYEVIGAVLANQELDDAAKLEAISSAWRKSKNRAAHMEQVQEPIAEVNAEVVQLREQLAELQRTHEQLQAENACRSLLESAGVKVDGVRIKALVALPDADRAALVETWKPATPLVESRVKFQPRSTMFTLPEKKPHQPNSPESFAALVR